ncbi:MAG: hypothetical protein KKC28_14425 [Verrucomicrobia bacterium]|nr:hypothetical protein [Verrucomicrobiota bacterium]MBU1858172.1 hypothetical protein [Verrucomicrobiota bacterium]
MQRYIIAIALLGVLVGALPSAWATDVGMPIYRGDIQKNVSLEAYYEKFKRDVEQDGVDGLEQKENRFIARATYFAGDRASLYGEIGATHSDEAEGTAPIMGFGLKLALYNAEMIQIGAFASAQYIHEIKYETDLEVGEFNQTENYFEINGGIVVSRFMKLGETMGFVPYAGVMASRLDGNQDYETVNADGSSESESGYIKDDGLFSIFAGAGLIINDRVGARLEGRFINQTSFTAGLTYLF